MGRDEYSGMVTRSRSRSQQRAERAGGAACGKAGALCVKASCIVKVYMVAYNVVAAAAWAAFAWALCSRAAAAGCLRPASLAAFGTCSRALLPATVDALAAVQGLAALEVLHAALGWVRSPVVATAMQIASRLFVVLLPARLLRAQDEWGVAYLAICVAWTLSDLTRYLYYVAMLLGCAPQLLKRARYTLFLVLYPLGTLGEMALIKGAARALSAAPALFPRASLAARLLPPATLGMAMLIVLAIYPFGKTASPTLRRPSSSVRALGFFYMYQHMLRQRAKHLCPAAGGRAKAD